MNISRLPHRRVRPGRFGAGASARSRTQLAGGCSSLHCCGSTARSQSAYQVRAAFPRGGGVRWENSPQPRGVRGRSVVQVTAEATSSPAGGSSCVAALTRAACRSRVGVRHGGARLAGGRTFGAPELSNSQGWNMRDHDGFNRRLTMQSTRRRNRLFAQTGQYCRRALLRR